MSSDDSVDSTRTDFPFLIQAVLEKYLQTLISIPMRDRAALCQFLNTDIAPDSPPLSSSNGAMEGYLTKRGRNFGGWQVRHFASLQIDSLGTIETDSRLSEGMADPILRSHSWILPLLLRCSERFKIRRDSSSRRCDRSSVFFSSCSRWNSR